MAQGFTVATFNANSIRARLEQILAWLARFQPDVLAIQETKTPDDAFPADPIRAAGYHVVFSGQKAHAGVALLSREEPLDVRKGLSDGGPADEPRLIQATVAGVTIVNTYVPQGRSIDSEHFQYKLEWLGRVREHLAAHFSPSDPVIWLGDLNVAPEPIDVYDPVRLAKDVDFHPDARLALQNVVAWGLDDVYRLHHPGEPGHYSYWDYRMPRALERNLGWRIDLIYATAPLAAHCAEAWIDVEARRAERPSDHTFVVARFDL